MKKVVAMMVVGTGEIDRYLEKALEKLSSLTSEIITACNAKDEKTRNFLRKNTISYDFSDFEWGKQQWKIKEILFRKYIVSRKPDWVLSQDADEVFGESFTKEKLLELQERNEIAYTFYCVQLWDREDQMRVDGGWGNFRNVRYFKLISEASLRWQRTPLHCGLAPIYAYNWAADSEFLFKHYGYLKLEDRVKKDERYRKYDPKKIYRNPAYYESILGIKPALKPFNEAEFSRKLRYRPRQPLLDKIITRKIMAKTYYVQNKYGKIFPVPEHLLNETLQRPGMKLIEEKEYLKQEKRVPLVEPNDLQCPICGFVAKSKLGLIAHKRKHK